MWVPGSNLGPLEEQPKLFTTDWAISPASYQVLDLDSQELWVVVEEAIQ